VGIGVGFDELGDPVRIVRRKEPPCEDRVDGVLENA
jgi:hypothetical protein